VIVYILAAGIRKEGDKKDICKIAKKLVRAGLLDLELDNIDLQCQKYKWAFCKSLKL
jgi:hypothetical protein